MSGIFPFEAALIRSDMVGIEVSGGAVGRFFAACKIPFFC